MPSEPELDFFELFKTLDPVDRAKIDVGSTTLRLNPQQIIYEQGAPSDSAYVVASGVVEAITQSPDGKRTRSIAYMGKGQFFGELGVLTGHPRMAAVRACETAKVLRFDEKVFLNLVEKIPKLGLHFSRLLAARLHATSSDAHQNVYSRDLTGNLQRFDLLTIFQAITSMHHSGELNLNNSGNELIGSFFFRNGRVEYARFVHLVGVEAVWQGFLQSATEGAFSFRTMKEPGIPVSEEHAIQMESTDLLLQGVTHRDAYADLPESLRAMEGRLSPRQAVLEWNDPENAVPAGRIWDLIAKRPQPLASLWRRLNYSALTFLRTVQGLVATGQVELLPDEPAPPREEPGPSPLAKTTRLREDA